MNHQKPGPLLPPNIPISTPRNQSQFYATLRRYTERIKQQRDISLGYLNRVNELEAQLRFKDAEIDRLHRINKELADKLSLYTSVIERSQPKRSMRMSMLLGQNNMTQSIIQTKQQQIEYHDTLKPFQQFFIIDLSQADKGQPKFRFNFETSNNHEPTSILDIFTYNSSSLWQPEQVTISNNQFNPHFVLYLSNSPHTAKSNKSRHFQIIDDLNPSYYYFISCVIQREVVQISGKYFWVPVVYGFLSLLPFPDTFFRLLEQITAELKVKNQLDQKRLVESLGELVKCPVDMQVETRYLFMNKLHLWKVPDINNIDQHALIFSLGVIEKFALQLIIDVLILLLLEIPITVISQDELLLSQFMFFFLYVIKPLKYPYPIVFNVTQKLRDLLQSPFPTFTGCTDSKIADPYLDQRAVFDLDKKIAKSWPLLKHLDSSRDFLMKSATRIGSYSKFGLLTEQIIKGHQYRELEPYWKDFCKTQLYQNYIHKL